jgi:hypothetical protein
MAAPEVIDYPLASVSSFFLSFLQYQFSLPEVTPPGLRWDPDPLKSTIRISATYSPDQEKAGSPLSISIKRNIFGYRTLGLGDKADKTPNTFEDEAGVGLLEGSVDIIVTSEVAAETSSVVNLIAMLLQANRQELAGISGFIQHLSLESVSAEEIVKIDAVARRWACSLRLRTNLYMGWTRINVYDPLKNPILEQIEVTNLSKMSSEEHGSTTMGSDLFVDSTKNFGPLVSNNPQLFQKDVEKQWYYVTIKIPGPTPEDPVTEERCIIKDVVDNHTLKLVKRDENGVEYPYLAPSTRVDIDYELAWNSIHLQTVFPKRGP